MLQAELDTYIRLVDKQKGLNQMMSSRILQQTIMERDNSIKKELNWDTWDLCIFEPYYS